MHSRFIKNLDQLEQLSKKSVFENTGDFIKITGNNYNHISIVTLESGIVKKHIEDFISYKEIVLAKNVQERLNLFINKVKTLKKTFYVDVEVINLIKYGPIDEFDYDE